MPNDVRRAVGGQKTVLLCNPSPIRCGEGGPRNRLALYLGAGDAHARGVDLAREFKKAEMCGLRIVTVTSEGAGIKRRRRPILKRLIARMAAGEFETIVAVVSEDTALSTLPSPILTGDTWLPHQGKAGCQ
jgi:hypothetical protein